MPKPRFSLAMLLSLMVITCITAYVLRPSAPSPFPAREDIVVIEADLLRHERHLEVFVPPAVLSPHQIDQLYVIARTCHVGSFGSELTPVLALRAMDSSEETSVMIYGGDGLETIGIISCSEHNNGCETFVIDDVVAQASLEQLLRDIVAVSRKPE